MSENSSEYRPRCMHLHCKAMAVYGEAFEMDPEYQAGLTAFWCLRTHKNRGPDDDDVSLEMCSNSERGCFQEF